MTILVVADPQTGPSRCRECHAPIVWALTDSGRRMPVDAQVAAGGELELFAEVFPDGDPVEPGVQRVRRRPADRAPSSPAWRGHWVTCPARRRVPPAIAALVARARTMKWGPLFSRRGNA